MTSRATSAKTFLAALLTMGAVVAMAPSAYAQHVVTDNEAGKLTFDALTATPQPIVHRIVYRPSRRGWAPAHSWSGHTRSERAVQSVVYRHGIHANTMSHFGVSHRRRRG